MKTSLLFIILVFGFITSPGAIEQTKEATINARGFCLAKGGSVQETGDEHIHICCYSAGHKCLVVDEQKGYSQLIASPKNYQYSIR